MNASDKVRLILLEEFVKAQARNPRYSMRAYSQKIGIAQSAISEIFSGKRPITKKAAQRILEGLDRDPTEINKLVADEDTANPKYHSLDMDTYHVMADWHHYAILSLAETKDFQSSESWIAERLGITESVVAKALETLLRLDMIKKDPKSGKLTVTGEQFEAISNVATPALRKANRQNLELAGKALEQVPLTERDSTSITLCLDPARMDDARKMIKNFRRSFNRVMEAGHKKEVYKLSVQLFPLSQRILK